MTSIPFDVRVHGYACMKRSASDFLVDTLRAWGIDVVFGQPGDGINGIMEARSYRCLPAPEGNWAFTISGSSTGGRSISCEGAGRLRALAVRIATGWRSSAER